MPRSLFVSLCAFLWVGCADPAPPPGDYVARVGTAVLTEADLNATLDALPAGVDSMTARTQFVEQWVTAELMAREAEERGLRDEPEVQRQLVENERAVLAAALLGALYEETSESVDRADLEAYFQRNRERLRLREPYVRVRLIETDTRARAEAARAAMQQAMLNSRQDSLWEVAARTYAADTSLSLDLARTYVPESRLRGSERAVVWQSLGQLGPGQIGPVLEQGDTFYVLQLLDRAASGSEPQLAWIEDDVRRQVAIQARKQMLARHVQRLRTEAQARDELDLPTLGAEPGPDDIPADSVAADSTRAAS